MRIYRTLLAALTLAAAAPAHAAMIHTPPVVWLHVADGATQKVPNADVQLGPSRQRVANTDKGIVQARFHLGEVEAHRRAARGDRARARARLRDSRKGLRTARRTGDEARVDASTKAYIHRLAELDEARDHVGWHDAQVALARAGVRLARARCALAEARLESAQADLLDQHHRRFLLLPPRAFHRQVKRLEVAVNARRSDVQISESVADQTHTEYLASNE